MQVYTYTEQVKLCLFCFALIYQMGVHSCQGSVCRMREKLINYSYFVVKIPDKARRGRVGGHQGEMKLFLSHLTIKKSVPLLRLNALL